MKPEIEYVYNKLKKLRFDFNSIDFREFRNRYRYEPTLDRYVRKDDNDLFIAKDTFKPLEEELEYADKMHNLEEKYLLPPDVLIILMDHHYYYDEDGNKKFFHSLDMYHKQILIKKYENDDDIYGYYDHLNFKDYKKTFWLKEDKSE